MPPELKTRGEKWSPEVGIKVADFLTGNPNLTAAAKIAHGSPKLIFLWMRQSAKDQQDGVPVEQSKWGIRWAQDDDGNAPLIYFHEAALEARRLFGYAAESQVRSLLADPAHGGGGHLRAVMDGNGKPAFEVDLLVAAHALEYNDTEWEFFYGTRRRDDVWARDEKGALVPLFVRDPIPSQTLVHLIRSLFGDTYNPSDRREVDSHHTVEVLRMDAKPSHVSSLRADLEARLAAVRAHPDRESAKPTGPVLMLGQGSNPNDPPERISGAYEPPTLAQHPRAYIVPQPQPPKPKPPAYAKPNHRNLDSGERIGAGQPPPGGFSVLR